MMLKKKFFFNQMVNRREARFWEDIINQVNNYGVVYPKEKLKRLTKIIRHYSSLCDMSGKICSILKDIENNKSYIVSK